MSRNLRTVLLDEMGKLPQLAMSTGDYVDIDNVLAVILECVPEGRPATAAGRALLDHRGWVGRTSDLAYLIARVEEESA